MRAILLTRSVFSLLVASASFFDAFLAPGLLSGRTLEFGQNATQATFVPEQPPVAWVGFRRQAQPEGPAAADVIEGARASHSGVEILGDSPPLFKLSLAILSPGGEVQLTLTAVKGRTYRLEASTDLLDWSALIDLLQTSESVSYIDRDAVNYSSRFYRAVELAVPPSSFFNGPPVFTTSTENAANPSCGCGGEPTYNRGISLVETTSGAGETVGPFPGIGQDTGKGSVFLHSGEFVQRAVDLEIRGRGFNWKFERRYRSGVNFHGPLGHNWEFNYNRRLFVEADGSVLRMDGAGRADRYVLAGGVFQAPRGFYTKLIRNGDGTFTERDRHGTKVHYAAPNARGIARMVELSDRNGNRMRFEHNPQEQLSRVIDTLGRAIDYRYDADGRLIEVEDFTGRKLLFAYDGNGDLVTVTSPAVTGTPNGNDFPAGKTTRYRCSSGFADERLNHNLLDITAPNEVASGGSPRLKAEYQTDPASLNADRLLRLTLGGTNESGVAAGGAISYAYLALASAAQGDFVSPVSQTTVTDRNGNLAEYQFNQLGNVVRVREFTNRDVHPGDPDFFETRYEYNQEGELLRQVFPEGNSVEYIYDLTNPDRFQQGNLLRATRLPDAARGGEQSRIITTYTYEPLFNQLRTSTAPRGNDPIYAPQNGGVVSPERYTTIFTYDYQEDASPPAEAAAFGITIPAVLLNLGDQDGDGRTDQAGGNLIRRDDPTVTLLAGANQALVEGGTAQRIVTRYVQNDFGQTIQVEDPRGNVTTYSYFPENDPDGDGLDVIAGLNTSTGGYVSGSVQDALVGPRRKDTAAPVAITTRFGVDRRGNVVALTDGRGLVHRFTFNALDQVVEEEDPKVDASQATGYARRYFYDANNNRVGVDVQNVTTDPATHLPVVVSGHPFFQHRSKHDILDRVIEETRDAARDPAIPTPPLPESRTTRYEYDANENLLRALSPQAVASADADNYEAFTYDERDLRRSATRGGASAQASRWTFTYDRNRNRISWTDAEDNDALAGPETETISYDGFDRRRAVTDRAGNVQRYAYDPEGRVVREDFRGPIDATSTTQVLLRGSDFRYDELGRQFQIDRDLFLPSGVRLQRDVELTDGSLTPGDKKLSDRFEFDANSRRTFQVKDDGHVYQFAYDGANRLRVETWPLVDTVTPGGPYPMKIERTFDGNNNVIRKVETHPNAKGVPRPAVLTTLMVYDALDRLVRETDPAGHTKYREYDSRGNVVSAYDARGPLIADPLGLYAAGKINDRGNATRYAYDGLSRRWQEMNELTTSGEGGAPLDTANPYNPDGLITKLTSYDANSRIVSRTDDSTNSTFYAYDSLNRVVGQTNADGGTKAWRYDRDHHTVRLVDENNTVHTFVHDGLDRRISHAIAADPAKKIASGALPLIVGTTLQTFAYDGLSRLVRSADNNDPDDPSDDRVVTSAYDSLGRLVEEVQNGRAVSSGYASDDRTQLHYPGTSRIVEYEHDGLNHLVRLANQTTLSVGFEVMGACFPPLAFHYAIPTQVGDLAVEKQTINDERLVERIVDVCGRETVGFKTFTYDRADNVSGFTLGATFDVEFRDETITTGFDSQGRMTQFASRASSLVGDSSVTRSFLYTGANAMKEIRDALNAVLQILNYTRALELLTTWVRHNASPGTGIRTRDENFFYQWDGLNRLRVVRTRTNPANIVAVYSYDAEPAIAGGRRVQKTVANSGTLDGTTRFYYDGANCIEETAVAGGQEKVKRQFIFGSGPDEIHAMDADTNEDGDPDQLYFYFRDHNNNTTQLVKVTGSNPTFTSPSELYAYDFRGVPQVLEPATLNALPASPSGNPYLFTGQRYDAETGLYYYKARYYDPSFGVFMSRDPVGIWGDPADDGNAMAYAGNNPWTRRDPTGLSSHREAPLVSPIQQSGGDISDIYIFRGPDPSAYGAVVLVLWPFYSPEPSVDYAPSELRLFDQLDNMPAKDATEGAVTNPCGPVLLDGSDRKVKIKIDDLITNPGGASATTPMGLGSVIISGGGENVNMSGVAVDAKTSPGDLSVFGFEAPVSKPVSSAGGAGSASIYTEFETPSGVAKAGRRCGAARGCL